MFRLIWERVVGRTRVYRVYGATAGQRVARDDAVRVYDQRHPPPPEVVTLYRKAEGLLGSEVMMRRLHHDGAVMLALLAGPELAAYGWLQCWGPLRREFWWLADDAICLGPYWTSPNLRGQGLYGRLLAHSLAECAERFREKDVYIWVERENVSSCRGIERAGFRSLGEHLVSMRLFRLIRRHEESAGNRRLADPYA